MALSCFFPIRSGATPTIYAFAVETPGPEGLLKVGYAEGSAKDPIAQRLARAFPYVGYQEERCEVHLPRPS